MTVLDTDHVTVVKYSDSAQYQRLTARITAATQAGEVFGTTIISVEEQTRGWLAYIRAQRDLRRQVRGYTELAQLFAFFQRWRVLAFDAAAADRADYLQQIRLRVGTQDLKIAAIALTQNALLLSANLRDFSRVPGLWVENWLE